MEVLRIVIILLLCLLTINVSAQKSFLLSGVIRDTSNTPITQAMVTIENTNIGAYTDSNGSYSMKVKPGEHTISISAYGFNLQKETIKINNSTNHNFTLKKLLVDISEIQVYGKTTSQQLREGSFTVNALEVRNITSSLSDLNNLVGKSSGIKIREEGGVGSDFDLSINGLSGNAVRYFIDGVPLSSMGNGVSLANLPVNIVDRIEVYKGVVPAHLGSDALGGAINIITKKDKQNYLDASYGIGSFNTHKADFNSRYVHPKSGLFFQSSVGINYSKNNYIMKDVETRIDNKFVTTDAERFHDDYLSLLTQFIVGINNTKWADLFSISASYFNADKDVQTGSNQKHVYGMVTQNNQTYHVSAQYRKSKFLTKKLSTDIHISYTWDYKTTTDTAYRKYYWDGSYSPSQRNERLGGAKSIRHINTPLGIVRGNFTYTINNKHSLNLNYLLNHLTNDLYDDLDKEFKSSQNVFSRHIVGLSYNQQLWNNKLNNAFFIKDYISHLEIGQDGNYWITGAREINQSTVTNNYGYGFSSRYSFNEQIALKASYEHTFRLPLAEELLGDGLNRVANFKLKPEHSQNYNFGIFGTFNKGSKHHLFYETGLFYRPVEDYIRYVADINEGDGGQYQNVNNVTVKGIEGELRYDYSNTLGFIANITYLDERNKTKYQDNGKPDISYNNRIPNRPWLFGNLEINYRKENPFGRRNTLLRLSYVYQYVHWQYFSWQAYGYEPGKSRVPSQYMNNADLTYSLNNEKYNISFHCKNILNQTIYDNFRMQKPGRYFFLKLRIFLN
ncbi:MAG: TonB-dependent receptor [Marinilabiliaceae bacterium]|nr:TonB-dependent receptor [Marinilabiliaceae bacterium]